MKIVLVSDNYGSKSDGTAVTIHRLEASLIALGHEVRIVSLGATGPHHYALKERYTPLVTEVARKQKIRFAKFDRAVLTKALTGVDLVHLALPFQLERKTLKLCKELNIPTTGAFHLHPDNILKNAGILKYIGLKQYIFWLWKVFFYKDLKHVHCPTVFAASEMQKHHYPSTCHVISNGVPEFFSYDEALAKDKPQDGMFRILMIGRLAAEKRQDLLIEAIQLSKHKNKILVTFAGLGPRLKKYQKLATSLPNQARFDFFDQNQLKKEILTSDLYIHAAEVEIEGMSCLEALSCGLVPLIGNAKESATKDFALTEACLFESGNAHDLAKKIDYFIEHPDVLASLKIAYIEFSKQYRMPVIMELMTKMFQTAINEHHHVV